jgi:hypothetical protein
MSERRLTGTHIVVIAIAVCAAAVLTPVGVYAATTSRMSIADFDRPSRTAKVDTAGRIHTDAVINGPVLAPPAPPAEPFHLEGGKDAVVPLAEPLGAPVPQGKNIAVTSVNIMIIGTGTTTVEWREANEAGQCAAGTERLSTVASVRADGATDGLRNFVQAFPVPQVREATGRAVCLWAFGSPGVEVVVDGYLF